MFCVLPVLGIAVLSLSCGLRVRADCRCVCGDCRGCFVRFCMVVGWCSEILYYPFFHSRLIVDIGPRANTGETVGIVEGLAVSSKFQE